MSHPITLWKLKDGRFVLGVTAFHGDVPWSGEGFMHCACYSMGPLNLETCVSVVVSFLKAFL